MTFDWVAGFACGFFLGMFIMPFLGGLGRRTYRTAAFLDAADYVEQAASSAPPNQVGALIAFYTRAVSVGLRRWAEDPRGGKERMPPMPSTFIQEQVVPP